MKQNVFDLCSRCLSCIKTYLMYFGFIHFISLTQNWVDVDTQTSSPPAPNNNTVSAGRQHTSWVWTGEGKWGAGSASPLLTSLDSLAGNYTASPKLIKSSASVHQKINMAQRTHSSEYPRLTPESVQLGETIAEISHYPSLTAHWKLPPCSVSIKSQDRKQASNETTVSWIR